MADFGGQARFSDANLLGFLLLCAVLPYLNTLWNDFVFDDPAWITKNP
jgi:hypothetical protein